MVLTVSISYLYLSVSTYAVIYTYLNFSLLILRPLHTFALIRKYIMNIYLHLIKMIILNQYILGIFQMYMTLQETGLLGTGISWIEEK